MTKSVDFKVKCHLFNVISYQLHNFHSFGPPQWVWRSSLPLQPGDHGDTAASIKISFPATLEQLRLSQPTLWVSTVRWIMKSNYVAKESRGSNCLLF